MKLEELIVALAESNIDRSASDEIIERLEGSDPRKLGYRIIEEETGRIEEALEGFKTKLLADVAELIDSWYEQGFTDGHNIAINEQAVKRINQYAQTEHEEGECFTVLETYKEDMIHEFDDQPTWIAKIGKFTDDQMNSIADDVGSQLAEYYQDALRLAVEMELEKGSAVKPKEPEKGGKGDD